MIEVRHLVKQYDDNLAVDDLSFTIEPGRIYGFLGPNGAGKSTTMNIMTGYLGATSGDVIVNGHNILDEPEAAKKCIGYLPEMPPLYQDMLVREYLEFVAELKGVPKAERDDEVMRSMRLVRIVDMQERLIRNLSKGYRQRVGMAQAMIGSPDTVILDEPTVGLDPKQIIEIRQLIRELAKDHTVILSSHILAEVQEVCDYIMIISKGRLVASDTPDHLEELVKGSETIEITTGAGEQKVRDILHGFSEIEKISCEKDKDGNTAARIDVKEGSDICEKVFFAFADQRTALRSLSTIHATLEDVFLELTKNEADDRAAIEDARPQKKNKAKAKDTPENSPKDAPKEETKKDESNL